MKKRIVLLVTVASMLAAALALSGVAQAKPVATSADRQCMKLAIQTLPNFKPAHYTFHGGTDDIMVFDDFTGQGTTEGNDVFCGFGGQNGITTLGDGDIFIGGSVDDIVAFNNGTFYGQEGSDLVGDNNGTFYGGADNDTVLDNFGTFYGSAGDDLVDNNRGGTFYGEEGNDTVNFNFTDATFDGGAGDDVVLANQPGGILINVP